VAAGRANHAGLGNYPGIGLDQGNTKLLGIEAENTGNTSGPLDDYPWPEAQMDAYARTCAALLTYINAPVSLCIGHKEYAPSRKVDPSFSMPDFRVRVATFMKPKQNSGVVVA
jgi:N-acetyl-anhydromuramyl-L-alanine amidase AmpD